MLRNFFVSIIGVLLITSCYKDELDAANADNEMLRSQIIALNSQISSLNSQIVTLTSQASALNTEILRLKGVVEDADVEIAELEDIIVSYQTQLLELQTALLGATTSNENLLSTNEDLLSSISTNVEVLKYVSDRIISIASEFNESSQENVNVLNSLIKDLQSFINKYDEIKNIDINLNLSLVKHIKASQLLEGVDVFDFGETADPAVATTDCTWVDLIADTNNNVVGSFHPTTSTLILTHGDPSKNLAILNSNNDNIRFHSNFFGSPKRILIVAAVRSNSFSFLIDALKQDGHTVDYLYLTKEQFDESDYPELTSSNLSKYQAIYYDDGIGRPSTGIVNSLKVFASNPNKQSVFISLGWVWSAYRSTYDGEPLPINSVLEPIGAKFNTWINNTSSVKSGGVVLYPNTYTEVEVCE
jgi:predicted nuclease with TOPRIM domain